MKEEFIKLYQKIEQSDLENIKRSIEKISKEQNFLGEGKAGRVYTFQEASFCIKEIINSSLEFSFNNIESEMDIQAQVIKHGVRVPLPILILQTSEGKNFLVMERIFGFSIQDIEKGKANFPVGFDVELFFKEVKDMIAKMHENNLYHRDLHSGNIMINIKDGKIKPVIIDFGSSSYSFGEDDPYKEKNFPRIGYTRRFPEDYSEIKKTKDNCVLLLTKKL